MSDQGPSEYKYWAFISYSSKDKAWATWLHRSIETYGIPAQYVSHPTPSGHPAPRRFQPLFRDRAELPAAASLGPQIEASLQASRYLIVICSPNAARSAWVNSEIRTFQQLGRGDRILALIVDGEPESADGRECFPEALRTLEPLAADARPQGDGKFNARLKLVAGMLGVGFDALRQREAQRRIRRLWMVVAASLTVTLAFAALAWSRNRQRNKAIESRLQAESVLEFLVFNIQADLRNAGRVDIADNVRRRIDDYYIKLGTEAAQPITRHNQAAALANEGMLLIEKGDLEGARASLAKGLDVAERLAADEPENPRWQFDVSVALERKAQVSVRQGSTDEARASYDRCLTIREALTRRDPANAEWQQGLSSVHSGIGSLQLSSGDVVGALKSFEASRIIMQELTLRYPTNAEWQRGLGLVMWAQCGALLEHRDPQVGLGCYSTTVSIFEQLSQKEPGNAGRQHDLAMALVRLGDAQLRLGEQKGAATTYRDAMILGEELMRRDPGNLVWQHDASAIWSRMGDVQMAAGDPIAAGGAYLHTVETLERLTAADRSNGSWRRNLLLGYVKLADLFDLAGSRGAASWYRKAYDLLTEMQRRGETLPSDMQELERLRRKTGS